MTIELAGPYLAAVVGAIVLVLIQTYAPRVLPGWLVWGIIFFLILLIGFTGPISLG